MKKLSLASIIVAVLLVAHPGAFTAFVSDTFTDTNGTNVTAHTPGVGGGWVQHSSYSSNQVVINGNRAISNVGGSTVLIYSTTAPASADYSVTATIDLNNPTTAGFVVAVAGRIDTSADTFYSIQMYDSYAFFQLVARVAGTDTVIGTPVANGWSDGTTHTLGITFSGTTISAQMDGSTLISTTDSSITAAGRPGFRWSGGMGDFGSGDHYWGLDSIIADQAGGGGGSGCSGGLLLVRVGC